MGESNLDMILGDPPRYQDVAQYSCPEGYVFEIYQDFPNMSVNFGLIEDEQSVINLTCASYGDWLPIEVPPCIRKFRKNSSQRKILLYLASIFSNKLYRRTNISSNE